MGKVVTALVSDLIMPFVGMVTPSGEWRQIAFEIGSGKFLVGDFLGAVVDFVIIALVVFFIAKAMFKPEPAPATKNCPECTETIAAAATRRKWCTQAV